MVEVFHDLVESKLVLVKGDRLHSYATIHAHYTRLVLKYRSPNGQNELFWAY